MLPNSMMPQRWIGGVLIALIAIWVLACGGGGGGGDRFGGSLLVLDTIPVDGGSLRLDLPPGSPRSHEVSILFTTVPDRDTVLDPTVIGGLHRNVRVLDRSQRPTPGIAFLGGRTATGASPRDLDPDIDPDWAADIEDDPAATLRIVYDTDGKLSTPETLPAEQYTIRVSDQVLAAGGDRILEAHCAAFSAGPDVYGPVLAFTRPFHGETGVRADATIVCEFNESIAVGSVLGANPPAIQVTATSEQGSTFVLGGTIQSDPTHACAFTFQPDSGLPTSRADDLVTITVTVRGGVAADINGNVMPLAASSIFTMERGPDLANNPSPPNAVWYGAASPNEVGVIAANAVGIGAPLALVDTDGDGIATVEEGDRVMPGSRNTNVGLPADVILGDFVTSGASIDRIPLPNPPQLLPIGNEPTTFPSVCGEIPAPNGLNADLGVHVFVADSDHNVVRVLNSNTSLEIERIPLPDPTGLAISPDLTTLYVANFGTASVSVVDVRDVSRMARIKEVSVNPQDGTKAIGRGPRAIAAQPDGEDVLVLNTRDESLSLMDPSIGYEVRKVIDSNIGPDPVDVATTWRQQAYPLGSGIYFGYISNRGADSISVFESGPNFPIFFGPDDISVVLGDSTAFHIRAPMGLQTDLASGLRGEGVWYVNSDDGSVGHLSLLMIQPPPNPYFPNPFMRFFKQTRLVPSLGLGGVDVAVGDNVGPCSLLSPVANLKNSFGQINPPLRGYVALADSVAVFDAEQGLDLGVRIPLAGVRKLAPYWKQ